MVTSPYDWKKIKWDENPQTNKPKKKKTRMYTTHQKYFTSAVEVIQNVHLDDDLVLNPGHEQFST